MLTGGAALAMAACGQAAVPAARPSAGKLAEPLPSAAAPRADGRLTLLWFREIGCPQCQRMDEFAYDSFDKFAARLVLVEKDMDDEPAAVRRFHVIGSPTFVLLDRAGAEMTRFHFEPDARHLEEHLAHFAGPL